MPLVSSKKMLMDAQKHGYAVVAFNIHNLETIKAVVEAAQEARAPVILQATPGTCGYAGLRYLYEISKVVSEEFSVPVALHLDHGDSKELAFQCIDAGFTSVMIDGSRLPFEENAALAKEVVNYARSRGVQVEAELGRVRGAEEELLVEEYEESLTDPVKAAEFVERTGIDSLAVAVGTAHGVYKGKPKIDFERLKRIKELVKIPLVLHGCSGVPDDMLKMAIYSGVCKINISTDIKAAFSAALKEYFEEKPEETDPRKYFKSAIEKVKNVARIKMRLAGASGRA